MTNGAQISWHLSYGWGKPPEKNLNQEIDPTGDRTRPAAWGNDVNPRPQRWSSPFIFVAYRYSVEFKLHCLYFFIIYSLLRIDKFFFVFIIIQHISHFSVTCLHILYILCMIVYLVVPIIYNWRPLILFPRRPVSAQYGHFQVWWQWRLCVHTMQVVVTTPDH